MVNDLESNESFLAWWSCERQLYQRVTVCYLHRFIRIELALLAGELSSLLRRDLPDRIVVLPGRHQSVTSLAASPRPGVSGLYRTGRTLPAANPSVCVGADRAACMPVCAIAFLCVAVLDTLIIFG